MCLSPSPNLTMQLDFSLFSKMGVTKLNEPEYVAELSKCLTPYFLNPKSSKIVQVGDLWQVS